MTVHLDVIIFPLEESKKKTLRKQNSRVVVMLLQGMRYLWRHEIQGTDLKSRNCPLNIFQKTEPAGPAEVCLAFIGPG